MSQSALLDNERLFFCFGPPKSGTTFLQRVLNLHPEVSCPSEHQFGIVISRMEKAFQNYQSNLQLIDSRTGGQGITPMRKSTFARIIRFTIESMMREAAKNGETIIGANDNAIRKNLEMFNEIFERPRMIYIFRNPIDMAISAWHHNHRLAEEETNPEHKQQMAQYGDLDGWIKQYARWFAQEVSEYRNFSRDNRNITVIRYEDLVSDKRKTMCRLFDFLGAKTNDDILKRIENKSSLAYMRRKSSNPDFFRSASTDMGTRSVSDTLRREVIGIAEEALAFLSYLR